MYPIFNNNKLKTLEECIQHWIFSNLLGKKLRETNGKFQRAFMKGLPRVSPQYFVFSSPLPQMLQLPLKYARKQLAVCIFNYYISSLTYVQTRLLKDYVSCQSHKLSLWPHVSCGRAISPKEKELLQLCKVMRERQSKI